MMSSALIDQALREAVRRHQAGNFPGAEAIYRQILAVDPANPDATHLLGVLAHAAGRLPEASDLIRRAITAAAARNPTPSAPPHYHANLAAVLRDAADPAGALAEYERAIRLGDSTPETRGNLGIVLLQLHRDPEAAACFEASLAARPPGPARAGVWCNLAAARLHLGQLDAALDAARVAVREGPDLPAAHASLGTVLAALRRDVEARHAFDHAVRLAPNLVEAYLGLAEALARLRDSAGAVAAATRATQLRPGDHTTWTALGVALIESDRHEEALGAFARARAIMPGFAPAYTNAGVVLTELGRYPEALDLLRQAADLAPADPVPQRNLALGFHATGAHDRAADAAHRAHDLDPADTDSLDLLGATLGFAGRTEEAVEILRRAAVASPGDDRVRGHLGIALERAVRFEESIPEFEAAVRLATEGSPSFPVQKLRLGGALLRLGHFDRGWREYEGRLSADKFRHLDYPCPRWHASTGKPTDTVILADEQGFGDAIQFVRFAQGLRRRCARVILHTSPELASLLAAAPGVDQVVVRGQPLPRADAWVPMMSLPLELGFDERTVGAHVPYLRPDPVSAALWRRGLEGPQALRVGLVWAGDPRHALDRARSVPWRALLPLAQIPRVAWVSLQKGKGAADMSRLSESGWNLRDAGAQCKIFADTAAVMAALDLVITVDTAPAHLAGALGVPVWVLHHAVPEWRWMIGRSDSPWYPSAQLYRQTRAGEWSDVIERVAADLRAMG
jgi:tetratricopeptide (TPR) repeat protein